MGSDDVVDKLFVVVEKARSIGITPDEFIILVHEAWVTSCKDEASAADRDFSRIRGTNARA